MRRAARGKKAANESRKLTNKLEKALAKQAAEQDVKVDRNAWLRATRLRDTAVAMAALEVAEVIRELKEEIADSTHQKSENQTSGSKVRSDH